MAGLRCKNPGTDGTRCLSGRILLSLLLAAAPAAAQEIVACAYPDRDSRELEPAANCGSLADDGLLTLRKEILERVDWNEYGLQCAYVSATRDDDGWYYINQQGAGRSSPFGQDNDCAPFTAGLAAGLSRGKVIFYDAALEIVRRTDYVWASGFHHGFAKVCRGALVKKFDASGEHYEYRGGQCGFIDTDFAVVVEVAYPYQSTPHPESR